MKSFYTRGGVLPSPGRVTDERLVPATPVVPDRDHAADPSVFRARLAVYDSPAAAPRTVDVSSATQAQLIEDISSQTYALARDLGGEIPYTVIRECAENFIHADFLEPVVSILDGGHTVRFADQGPGIRDKERAQLPGYTTATYSMKHVIRGVGSGLPIVREYLAHSGGFLEIADNLGSGTVVTVSTEQLADPVVERSSAIPAEDLAPSWDPAPHKPGTPPPAPGPTGHAFPPLTTRQKQVLSLVLEIGEAGPTIVSKELSVALSTAHRDLAYLEQHGLIESDVTGKRVLTAEGSAYLDSLFSL